MNSQREAFEKVFPVPYNTAWNGHRYVTKSDLADDEYAITQQIRWEGWQAATEQGVGEAVFVHLADMPHGPGEVFVEIETAAGVGVQIPSMRKARGRTIGPLYRKPTGGGVPECPYPCGWRELHSIITRKAAYFARATAGDEVWDDQARCAGIDLGIYAREMCSLLATQQPPEQD